jgi:hypothetical protein
MNHIINLVVQEFFKNIKGLVESNEVDIEQAHENSEPTAKGFAVAMSKIRTITKVYLNSRKNFVSFIVLESFLHYFSKLC